MSENSKKFRSNEDYDYNWVLGSMVDDKLLNSFSDLYSAHYGRWSEQSPKNPSKQIRLSSSQIKKWLASEDSKVACAYLDNVLVGYVIAIRTKVPYYGIISWGTQLVVHSDHRQNGIGKMLLWSIWGFSDHFAWGILTPNPYAVRALEKATRRRCVPKRIKKHYAKLLSIGIIHLPYLSEEMNNLVNTKSSKVNTSFFVNHLGLDKMIESVTDKDKPWLLGNIEEGWEWFAFTFKDQDQLKLSASEINQMLETSDKFARIAYSRMMERPHQPWAKFTDKEVEFIIRNCKLDKGNTVVDFGCGSGRHSFALSKNGMNVTGVDYLSSPIEKANEIIKNEKIKNLQFIDADCRTITLEQKFDAAICLYDVVGTFAKDKENLEIIKNIHRHLKLGGRALISVMNIELTRRIATNTFSFEDEPQKLLELPASQIMEKTGNIFDPNYFILDGKTNLVYRKEQFSSGTNLPIELIVRDRRYSMQEISEMCKSVGFKVLWMRFSNAGNWKSAVSKDSDKAKEILILCEKN